MNYSTIRKDELVGFIQISEACLSLVCLAYRICNTSNKVVFKIWRGIDPNIIEILYDLYNISRV